MGYKEDIEVVEKSLAGLRRWTEKQQDAIGELQVNTAVAAKDLSLHREYTEGQFKLLRKAMESIKDALEKSQREFSKAMFKIIIWVVSIITTLAGLGIGAYNAFT